MEDIIDEFLSSDRCSALELVRKFDTVLYNTLAGKETAFADRTLQLLHQDMGPAVALMLCLMRHNFAEDCMSEIPYGTFNRAFHSMEPNLVPWLLSWIRSVGWFSATDEEQRALLELIELLSDDHQEIVNARKAELLETGDEDLVNQMLHFNS